MEISEEIGAARLRAALDATIDALLVTDSDGVIVEANRAFERISAIPREHVIGRSVLELVVEDGGSDEDLAAIRTALDGDPITFQTLRRGRTQTVRATPLPEGGALFATHGLEALREQGSRAARARVLTAAARVLTTPQGLDETLGAITDLIVPDWADGCLLGLMDDGAVRVAGVRHADQRMLGDALAMLPPRLDEMLPGSLLERVVADREPLLVTTDTPLPPRSRERVDMLGIGALAAVPLTLGDTLLGLLFASTDVGADRQLDAEDLALLCSIADRAAQAIEAARLNDAMRAAEERFRAAFEHAPIGIALFRADAETSRYVDINPAFSVIAGYPREVLLSRAASEFTHPDDRPAEQQRLRWLVERRVEEVSGEKRLVRPDGDVRWVQARTAPLGDDGTFVSQVQDITERRRFQAELEHMASHDALTGLLNRRRFEEALETSLAHVRRHGDSAAVLTLDLDNFKHVNDAYGHAVGDELLRAVSAALQARVRATDRLSRLGGDEFGVILSRTDPDAARAVAQSLLEALREVRVTVGERVVRVTASAGLRLLELGDESDAGELLSEADIALYDAKEHGRDRLSVLNPGDKAPAQVRERMLWSERIRDALDGDGLVLFEQPIVRLSDGVADRSELLVRLVLPDAEPAAAAGWLPVAERYGLVQAIDRWVVAEAVRLLAARQATGDMRAVEVNLSGESISDRSVIDAIVAEIEAAEIDPSLLIFEVTETSAIGNLERARGLAERLIALGCGFALDDFGAGFGSFAYLKHLPVDVIKIDGQFIRSLWDSKTDQVTVRAMVDVARGLGKETVAEFVEDEGTLGLLRELGVDRAQGYHIGRPRPVSA